MERLNQYQIDLLIQKLLDGGMIDWCNDHKCEVKPLAFRLVDVSPFCKESKGVLTNEKIHIRQIVRSILLLNRFCHHSCIFLCNVSSGHKLKEGLEIYEDEIVFIDDSDNIFRPDDIGKTIFLTREEAEKAIGGKEDV